MESISSERILNPTVEHFRASDGYVMQVQRWKPCSAKPLGYIAFLHGIQSHAGWYEASCRQFCEAGYDVRFLDRRGSGGNGADRGHACHADRLINDVFQWMQTIHYERDTTEPCSPVVLLGISWGGKLAVVSASRKPGLADGVALLCPGLTPFIRPNRIQKCLLNLGMRAGKSRHLVPIPLSDPSLFTDNPAWQAYIQHDPLTLHHATIGLLSASVALDEQVPWAVSVLPCPSLLMLAGRDRIINNAASLRLWGSSPAEGKTVISFDEACHTLEFDAVRDHSVQTIIQWMQSACTRPERPLGNGGIANSS